LQILSTSIVLFLKPSLKGILQIVKQDYYDLIANSVNLYCSVFETSLKRDFAICQTGIINLYHCVFETSPKRYFAICQTGLL
jgi:hypothetical protein